ncbi:MAG: hypothetical protein PHQ04_05760 [Opitutaceae bacterium]|nr:hypothetical protein [Opitutaceae bacterium]
MPSPDQRPKITVEDLLRLKRAERPSEEFWTTFERELREKQLAALVKKERWWQGFSRSLLRPAACLPVGAAAVLALTFVSLKYYSPSPSARFETQPVLAAASSVSTAPALSATLRRSPLAAPAIAAEVQPEAVRFDDRVSVTKAEPAAAPAPVADAADVTRWSDTGPAAASDSPSARFIAANLQRLEQADPELMVGLLNDDLVVSTPRVQRSSVHAIDLRNVASNFSRRSRIIPVDLSSRQAYRPEPAAPELVRERNARRLATTDISDQISRLNVRGDRLSFKL